MKKVILLIVAFTAFTSCSKDNSPETDPETFIQYYFEPVN